MSGKRKVRRVLVMIDYGDGDTANGEVFDLTALALECAPRGRFGDARISINVQADKTYKQAPEPQHELTIDFGGYFGGEFISGATHLDDVVNSAMPDGEKVTAIKRKRTRLENKIRDLGHDAMVAKLHQVAAIRHTHPIARFNEPLPELPAGVPLAPALTSGGAS